MQQAKIQVYGLNLTQTDDVTNIYLINNMANIKGICNKDDINILARACECVRAYVCVCVCACVCVCVRARARVCV